MYGWKDKLVAVGALAMCCAVLRLATQVTPAAIGYGTHTQLGLPPCLFLTLTHLPCPSCGLTTCFAWAVRGQFGKAFLANPFGVVAFLATVAAIPTALVLLWRRISFKSVLKNPRFEKGVYAATVFYFVSWIFKLAEFHFASH